ncbi:TonB-linked SusC/RagA family outer membrane protein [Flavobacteriaceae bacterium MAR_2009_75]|nr:TonB-linked SusC/RagA family outer membrane protein [Flavobacteriaceae bacterium MAR_2009_75]
MRTIFKQKFKKWLVPIFMLTCFLTFSQTGKTVTGTITGADGEPLPGATVVQKGTTNGVQSDFDGNYQIQLISGANVLVFSYVGFSAKEEVVGAKKLIDVILQEDAQNLDEVVVIGYGSQKKSDITGAVASVGSEELEKAVFNSVDQVLQGRSSGVLVTSASGEPGAPASIRIRGNNSISGDNSPLYVIDGIPISGSPNFNPQEIENLEVLKDASATAIYGSRGANGVILITTKRGKTGETSFDLYSNVSFSTVETPYEVLKGRDYAEYRNEANAALGNPLPFSNPEQYEGQGFDWVEEIVRTGIRQEYGLNISGGGENARFFISGNMLNDEGVIINSQFKRGSVRANLDLDAWDDKLNLKFSLNGTQTQNFRSVTDSRAFPYGAGPIFNALFAEPIVPTLDFSGFTGEGIQFVNPYLEVTEQDDRDFLTNILGNVEGTLKITDNLSYTFNGGLNFRLRTRDIFTPSTVAGGLLSNAVGSSGNSRAYDYIVSNYLTYTDQFGEDHEFSATLGAEYSEFNNYGTSLNVNDFDIQLLGFDNFGVATGIPVVGSNRSQSTLQSGFARFNYSFKNKYLLTATMRADGSSRFAENEKWGYFPSAAVGWRISEEEFLKDNATLSNLKLRASWGETGSQAIAPYQSLSRYGTSVYSIGNSAGLAYIPQSVANPNLKWETTEQTNVGLDLGLFRNRINFTADYFVKTTKDLLQSIQIPSQSGFGGALVNFGSIENKGIELNLDALLVNSNNFQWNSSLNYTSYNTEILELGGAEEIFGPGMGVNVYGSGHIYRPGEQFGRFFGLNAIGLIQESDFDGDGNPTFAVFRNDTQLGHWKFEDVDGDGVITNEDRKVIGNPNPDFLFGWNNDFTYKNLTLNVFVQGSIGNDLYNPIRTTLSSGLFGNESYRNQSVEWYENRWTPENPTNDIRFPSINSTIPAVANYMVEDGSYIRLRNISLRYNVPLPDNIGINGLQVFATGTNLVTITDYSGFDPEVNSLDADTLRASNGGLAPGVDLAAYPRPKTFTFGINLSF